MVEVFRTNVTCSEVAADLLLQLKDIFPDACINFDLEDCDKILRLEAKSISVENVITLIHAQGFDCELLMD